jgi:hypothetical protein
MIGTNVQAQECFYSKQIQYKDGSTIEAVEKYDCSNSPPPDIIIVEKEIPSKNRSFGEFLFGVEENSHGVSKLFSTLVSIGVF